MGHTSIHQLSFILNLKNTENSIHLHDFGKFNTIHQQVRSTHLLAKGANDLACFRRRFLVSWRRKPANIMESSAKGNYSSWLPWFPLPRYYEAHLLLAISRASSKHGSHV